MDNGKKWPNKTQSSHGKFREIDCEPKCETDEYVVKVSEDCLTILHSN